MQHTVSMLLKNRGVVEIFVKKMVVVKSESPEEEVTQDVGGQIGKTLIKFGVLRNICLQC